jgi:hypothetical protein
MCPRSQRREASHRRNRRSHHRYRKTMRVSITRFCYISLRQLRPSRHDHKEMPSQRRTFYGSSAVLKSPRDCTMLGSLIRRVGLIDITVGDAPRRIVTFRDPGGSRALARTAPSIACASETPTAASRRLKPSRSDNDAS